MASVEDVVDRASSLSNNNMAEAAGMILANAGVSLQTVEAFMDALKDVSKEDFEEFVLQMEQYQEP